MMSALMLQNRGERGAGGWNWDCLERVLLSGM